MPKASNNEAVTFTKSQIVNSNRYRHDVDVVNALLDDKKRYKLEEVDKIIDNFRKGRVK